VLKTTSKKEEEELDEEPAFSQLDAKRPENPTFRVHDSHCGLSNKLSERTGMVNVSSRNCGN
jgi:hypothetical protein